jgi:hypothetical protein
VRAWLGSSGRCEYDDRNFALGVALVDVIAALRARMDEPREPTILSIHKRPQAVAFITDGGPGGRRGSLPAELDIHAGVGGDVQVPTRMMVRPAV